jgi:hypothetical protein
MARGVYSIVFANVSVTLVQDLFLVLAGSTHKAIIHGVQLGAISTAVQNLQIRAQRLPATVTNGTGGTAPTPQKTDPQDAAASITARVNDSTTQTSSGGTASNVL